MRPVLDALERMALAATTQHLVFWRPLQAMQREHQDSHYGTILPSLLSLLHTALETPACASRLPIFTFIFAVCGYYLQRSTWAKQNPTLLARLLCNPASCQAPKQERCTGRGGEGFRVATEQVVRKLRVCLEDAPSLSLAAALQALEHWVSALRPLACRHRDVLAAFSQALRDGAFLGLLAHAESNMPEGRAIVSDLAAVENPIRMVGELLWAIQDQVCVCLCVCARALLWIRAQLRAMHARAHTYTYPHNRAHTQVLTPVHHVDAVLVKRLRDMALEVDSCVELMGVATPGEVVRLLRWHALLAPHPIQAPADDAATGRVDLGEYAVCAGGGWDREAALWAPPHRREVAAHQCVFACPQPMNLFQAA